MFASDTSVPVSLLPRQAAYSNSNKYNADELGDDRPVRAKKPDRNHATTPLAALHKCVCAGENVAGCWRPCVRMLPYPVNPETLPVQTTFTCKRMIDRRAHESHEAVRCRAGPNHHSPCRGAVPMRPPAPSRLRTR